MQRPAPEPREDDAGKVERARFREAHHRIKNNLQLIASLINLQANEVEDRRARALFEETRNRVYSIARVYEWIDQSQDHVTFDMVEYAKALAPEVMREYDAGQRLEVIVEGQGARLDLDRAVPFGLLLNELVANARWGAAAGLQREMTICFARENGDHILTVAGIRRAEEIDGLSESSLSWRLVRMLAQQLGGTVEYPPGNGDQVEVRFPLTELGDEGAF